MSFYILICKHCKRKFRAKSRRFRFCGRCGTYYFRVLKPKRPKHYFTICQNCGKKVIRKSNIQKFCSKKCGYENIRLSKLKSQRKYINRNRYRRDYKERHRLNSVNQRRRYPLRIKARQTASNKIKIPRGQLCQDCGLKLAKNKHHDDYLKPMEVKYLCIECHRKLHRKINRGCN